MAQQYKEKDDSDVQKIEKEEIEEEEVKEESHEICLDGILININYELFLQVDH